MPNWCRNVIKCEKDVIKKIKNKYLYEASSQESQSLDFQKNLSHAERIRKT